MNKKKILILNGSHSDIPLITSAHELGFYVITTGNNPNLIGHKYSDEFIQCDFSEKEEILSLAQNLKIDVICSCTNDFGAITAAYVAEKMNLGGHDSYETSLLLHTKDRFKNFAKEHNIMTPEAFDYDNIEDALKCKIINNFPLIIKPTDLTGGKNVTKVLTPNELIPALKRALSSKSHKCVIEKFLDGTYHSFSTFLINKKIMAYFSDNEYSYKNPFLVTTSAGPADNIEKVKDILIYEIEKIAKILNLADGIFHVQYILYNDKPFIMDITRRCSGDWYSEPVRKALGLDWAKFIVKAEANMNLDDFTKNTKQTNFCGRHCIMANKNGKVKDVIINSSLYKNIYKSFIWWDKKFIINDFLHDKLGILFLEYSSREEMIDKTEKITDLIKVIVD